MPDSIGSYPVLSQVAQLGGWPNLCITKVEAAPSFVVPSFVQANIRNRLNPHPIRAER